MRRWGIATVAAAIVLGGSAGVAQAATWTVDSPTVGEGDSGTTQVTFTVSASGLGLLGGSIGYHTEDGTASAPGDYTAATGTATISTLVFGSGSTTVTVDVNGDTAPERDETFRLVLDDGTSGMATILNDDAPHLSVSDPTVSEHDGTAVFTVSLDGAANVSVHYATADGSAQAGQDYQPASGTLTFGRSDVSRQVTVPIVDDAIHEDTETFALNLSGASGVASSGNDLAGTATILDDDAASAAPSSGGGSSIPGPGSPGIPATTGSSLADTTNPQPVLSKPRSSRGTIVISVGCPATELLCRGTLTTFAEPDRHSKLRWMRSEHKLGSATFVIAGGKRALITMRISKAALRQLRRAGKVAIRSYVVVRDAAGNIGTASVGARLARVR